MSGAARAQLIASLIVFSTIKLLIMYKLFKSFNRYSLLVLLAVLVSLASCTKDKIDVADHADSQSFEMLSYQPRFDHLVGTGLGIHQPLYDELDKLYQDLAEQNEELQFLDKWTREYGVPFWDYSTKDLFPGSNRVQVTVPFIKNGQVSAILIANVDSGISYKLFARKDIQRFAIMNSEVTTEDNLWLAAAMKLVLYDLHIYSYNQRTLAEWVVRNSAEVSAVNTDPKCDVAEVCFTYVDWDDPAIVYACVELIVCGGTGGPGGQPDLPGGGGDFPGSEDPSNGGSGTGTGTPDEGDPEFELCGGPCFDCDFAYLLTTLYPDNCDPLTVPSLGACSILGQVYHPGDGCGLEAFVRKSDNNAACQVLSITNDQSAASVITTTNQCQIRYTFRAEIIANEHCFIVGGREGGVTIGPDGLEIDYSQDVTVNLPRLQLYQVYLVGIIPIDSNFRCYHDCGCY